MKVALETLGCKLNQAETELLAREFAEAGHELVSSVDSADVYILNTCTVTHVADSKSRHLLRLAHRRNPGALVVATGCYAQRMPTELAGIEGVGLVVGNDEKTNLLQLLSEAGYPSSQAYLQKGSVSNHQPALRTRAFIKVQDGCNNFCSYCIVPLVRGREKSLPVAQIISEVKHRVDNGYKEVVLTGTKIGSYSYDGITLKGLLKRILAEIGVELAQAQYLLPRLRRMWTHLNREGGTGQASGIGTRGPGEKQIEIDRRLLRKQITDRRRELDGIEKRRSRMADARSSWFTISLVGYTNAGKSTLFNALTDAGVYVQDQLFATLDPTVRRLDLPDGNYVVLADTVGFVRDLPHELIAAFKSTLQEAREADLILHLIDASDPNRWQRVRQVNAVLQQLEADDVPQIRVYNKIDKLDRRSRVTNNRDGEGRAV